VSDLRGRWVVNKNIFSIILLSSFVEEGGREEEEEGANEE